MPIFEFRCLECGDVFEKLFVHSDDEIDLGCPQCQSQSCERVVSRANYAMGAGKGGGAAQNHDKVLRPFEPVYDP